ncbi:MAG: BrnA antitoxin family protein [Desulfobacteraceae bacterium]
MKKSSKTDWEALTSMTDDEIDYSDIPPLPDAFFKRAKVWHPQPKVSVTVEIDADILEWFKSEAEDWEARVQTALRLYVEANKAYLQTQRTAP